MNKEGLGRASRTEKESSIFDNEIESLWRYRDVARFLRVSERTVMRGVQANKIPFASVGDSIRFCPWVLKSWAEKGGSL